MARKTAEVPEIYPTVDSDFYKGTDATADKSRFFQLRSVTHNVPFYFLPYNFKITETLLPQWKEETVIGRMDPIATFKRMGRTMTISFQARANKFNKASEVVGNSNNSPPQLTSDELLHVIDHVKKCLYPKYESGASSKDVTDVMTSPPLWRVKYQNLINAGTNTNSKGVLCYITQFAANPQTDPNKMYFDTQKNYIYPKVFDINMTITILNEQLAAKQRSGILNERYFYQYITDFHD